MANLPSPLEVNLPGRVFARTGFASQIPGAALRLGEIAFTSDDYRFWIGDESQSPPWVLTSKTQGNIDWTKINPTFNNINVTTINGLTLAALFAQLGGSTNTGGTTNTGGNTNTPTVQAPLQFYEVAGIYTYIAISTTVDLIVVGGGGSGGGSATYSGGGSGGGGGVAIKRITNLVVGQSYSIIIGAGGISIASGVANAGNTGGTSSAFGVSATGGHGGQAMNGGPAVSGGVGGQGAGGDRNYNGSPGGAGANSSPSNYPRGGEAPFFGGGGINQGSTSAQFGGYGNDGCAPGAGGAGGYNQGYNSGAGAPGAVYIQPR